VALNAWKSSSSSSTLAFAFACSNCVRALAFGSCATVDSASPTTAALSFRESERFSSDSNSSLRTPFVPFVYAVSTSRSVVAFRSS